MKQEGWEKREDKKKKTYIWRLRRDELQVGFNL